MIVDAIIAGLVFYFTFPLLTGYCALQYGRSFGIWFAIGCVLPIVSFLILVALIYWDEKTTPVRRLNRRERMESEILVKDLVDNVNHESDHTFYERPERPISFKRNKESDLGS